MIQQRALRLTQASAHARHLVSAEVEALRADLLRRGVSQRTLDRVCAARVTRFKLEAIVAHGKSTLEDVLGEAWEPSEAVYGPVQSHNHLHIARIPRTCSGFRSRLKHTLCPGLNILGPPHQGPGERPK